MQICEDCPSNKPDKCWETLECQMKRWTAPYCFHIDQAKNLGQHSQKTRARSKSNLLVVFFSAHNTIWLFFLRCDWVRLLLLKRETKTSASFCIVSSQIRKLSRWEVIHVVRTMSTEAAKSGEEGKKTTSAKKWNAVLQTALQSLVSCGIVEKALLNGSPVARSRLENNFSPKWSPFSFLQLKLLFWKRWSFYCVYPNRYEQVCPRIEIHDCWASRTLQRRMSENIWFTKQVSDRLERL